MTGVNWGLVGNRWAVELLRRQLARSTTHHAYLITGPEGAGRARLATAFAQALLCEQPPEPGGHCGTCRACRQVPQHSHPDLHWVERLPDKQGLTIEQVRELQRQLALAPMAGARRVAVLTEVDKASEGAANALLKTLEEPAPRVHLVLTASDVEEVPPTIASRCEVLALRPVPAAEITGALEAEAGSAARAREVAALADGRPELARRMLSDPGLYQRRAGYAADLDEVLSLGLPGRFALAERWKDDENLEERLRVWLIPLGESLRADAEASTSRARRVGGVAQARQALEATLRTLEALRKNANTRLAIETLMLDLPRGVSSDQDKRTGRPVGRP
jgi:DNA polymerase-3 subunit delta'